MRTHLVDQHASVSGETSERDGDVVVHLADLAHGTRVLFDKRAWRMSEWRLIATYRAPYDKRSSLPAAWRSPCAQRRGSPSSCRGRRQPQHPSNDIHTHTAAFTTQFKQRLSSSHTHTHTISTDLLHGLHGVLHLEEVTIWGEDGNRAIVSIGVTRAQREKERRMRHTITRGSYTSPHYALIVHTAHALIPGHGGRSLCCCLLPLSFCFGFLERSRPASPPHVRLQ